MSPSIQLRTGIFKQLEAEFLVKLDSGHQSKPFHGSKKKKRVTDKEHIIERLRRQQVSKKLTQLYSSVI